MEDIKKSMQSILDTKKDHMILYNFAYKKFKESNKQEQSAWFNGYEVLDENTLRIKYQYGGGDLIMDSGWDVKIN